ncbi:MAG: putative conserved rane protein [Sediminibacterium sp.]|nr:putative conserved rane protein [Sediminibacterium sp.]
MPILLDIPANIVEYIGYFGSFLTSITFIPQVYKSWQSRSVGDLSVWMILIVITSTIVWLVYGFAIHSGPVIVANIVVLVLTLVLFYFKLSFKKQ